jgi:predicted GNAT family N-acyltransferase
MTYKIIQAQTDELKNKAFRIREEVFVIEQKVERADEFDHFESESFHFVALDENEEPIGAARWRTTEKGVKLERFAVKKGQRGKGIGTSLVSSVLHSIQEKMPQGTYLYMHSQLEAVALYTRFGFEKEGDVFDECGIMHYLMWKYL